MGLFSFQKRKWWGGGREKLGKAKLKENKKKMKGKPHARYHGSSITRSFISLPPPPAHGLYTETDGFTKAASRTSSHSSSQRYRIISILSILGFFFFILRIVFVFPSFISNLKAIEARECVGGGGGCCGFLTGSRSLCTSLPFKHEKKKRKNKMNRK